MGAWCTFLQLMVQVLLANGCQRRVTIHAALFATTEPNRFISAIASSCVFFTAVTYSNSLSINLFAVVRRYEAKLSVVAGMYDLPVGRPHGTDNVVSGRDEAPTVVNTFAI